MGLVHTYFAKVYARDGLYPGLSRGLYPTASAMYRWVVKSALTEFRREGKDAQARTTKGAKTERDRMKGLQSDQCLGSPEQLPVYLTVDGEGSESEMVSAGGLTTAPLRDVVDLNPEPLIQAKIAREQGRKIIEQVIRRYKRGNPERMVRIFRMHWEGAKVEEIGEAEGVSRNRAAGLLYDLRDALKKADERGDLKEVREIFGYGVQF